MNLIARTALANEGMSDVTPDGQFDVVKQAWGGESAAYLASKATPMPVQTVETDSPYLDAFGRKRVSATGQRFDVEFIYDLQPTLVDAVTEGSATVAHNASTRDVTLAVGDADNATQAALYSHYDVPYTAGNSQNPEVTGTLDDADIGGGTAQLFLRTSISGSVAETVIDQNDWNVTSPADVDWKKSQIFAMDFQSLKVGRVRYMLVRNGVPVILHALANDNVRDSGYWQSPTLPLYWRIYNDETYTYAEMGYGDTANGIGIRYRIPVNAAAKLRAICGTVKSEGGASVFDMPGFPRCADNGTTAIAVADTLRPVLSIRPAATINSITNRGLYVPTGFSVVSDNPIRYVILYRPNLTGANWTPVNATHSGMEYDVTASSLAGGIPIVSDYLASGRNALTQVAGLLGRSLLSLGRTGVSDVLTLAAIRTTTSSASTYGAFTWKEIR